MFGEFGFESGYQIWLFIANAYAFIEIFPIFQSESLFEKTILQNK
jgi:hypothetical protein